MKPEIKELQNHWYVDVNEGVGILPYVVDEESALDQVGIVIEKLPYFDEGFYRGLVLGTIEKTDKSVFARAKQELKEETGYEVNEKSRWISLGEFYSSKSFDKPLICYAVDITGITPSEILGDGSEYEKGIDFKLLSLSEAGQMKDSLFMACLFKLYLTLNLVEDGNS